MNKQAGIAQAILDLLGRSGRAIDRGAIELGRLSTPAVAAGANLVGAHGTAEALQDAAKGVTRHRGNQELGTFLTERGGGLPTGKTTVNFGKKPGVGGTVNPSKYHPGPKGQFGMNSPLGEVTMADIPREYRAKLQYNSGPRMNDAGPLNEVMGTYDPAIARAGTEEFAKRLRYPGYAVGGLAAGTAGLAGHDIYNAATKDAYDRGFKQACARYGVAPVI